MSQGGYIIKDGSRSADAPTNQADAVLTQDNPVSGTKYTVLAPTPNCRIIGAAVKVTWTVQPTPLEMHVTIDGVLHTFTFTDPVTATNYTPLNWNAADVHGTLLATAMVTAVQFMFEGRSIGIQVETTGGTVSNLYSRVKYATW